MSIDHFIKPTSIAKKSATDALKTRVKRSVIWNFFNKSENGKFVVCSICKAELTWSGNTSNAKHHLERYHSRKLSRAEGNNSIISTTSSEDGEQVAENTKETAKRKPYQLSIRKYTKRSKGAYKASCARKKMLDNKLLMFVVRDLQPLCVVDDVGFTEFVKALDPRYAIPSRRRLRDVLVEGAYKKTHEHLHEILKSVKYIGVTFDGWTSRTTHHYLSITCHFMHNHALKSATLAVTPVGCRSTAINLNRMISDVFQKFSGLFVVAAVTDNAANVVAACRELKVTHIPCSAHSIQLVVNRAILRTGNLDIEEANDQSKLTKFFEDEENEDLTASNIYTIVKKCKKITSFFHHSTVASSELEKELKNRNLPEVRLVQAVETRWNSTYFMLERIYKTSEAIVIVLLNVSNSLNQLTTTEIKMIPFILKVLQPFLQATEKLSGESYATMSLIIPCVKHIMAELDNVYVEILDHPQVLKLHKELRDLTLEKLLSYEERRPISGITTILDPRFKEHGFYLKHNYLTSASHLQKELKQAVQQANEKKKQINTISSHSTAPQANNYMFNFLNKIPVSSHSSSTINSFSQSIVHLNNYLEESLYPMDTDIIEYWENYTACAELKAIALRYLIVPATSVPSERVNSTAGNTITEKRARLSPILAEKLIFLRKNFDFIKTVQ